MTFSVDEFPLNTDRLISRGFNPIVSKTDKHEAMITAIQIIDINILFIIITPYIKISLVCTSLFYKVILSQENDSKMTLR